MSEFRIFVARADEAEREIEKLRLELEALTSGSGVGIPTTDADDEKIPEELQKLRVENSKLKYRLGILKRATEAEKKRKWTLC